MKEDGIMQKINLKKETIKAIADRINGTEIEGQLTTVTDAEFEQDGFLIMVDYEVYAEWRDQQMRHSEVPYNNIEDLSGWERDGAAINFINAYGDDGEDVEIEKSDLDALMNEIAA